jgi:phospholipid/cholesterol/gamma-HCH transport system permease protein
VDPVLGHHPRLIRQPGGILPHATGLYAPLRRHRLGGAALGGFARRFAVLLLIEVISLMGNYY